MVRKYGHKARRSRKRELDRKLGDNHHCRYRRTSLLESIHVWFKRASRQHSRAAARRQLKNGDYDAAKYEERLDQWEWD